MTEPRDHMPIQRALLSVSDKTGLLDLARRLDAAGVELLSTDGTAAVLREAGLSVLDVAEITGFPEMLDGRVKTLHPSIHGALLARRDLPAHMEALERAGITPIDLVVVNLYPFEKTLASGADFTTCIENIDIGGPAMIRAAAKNHESVAVIVSPEDYGTAIAEIEEKGGITGKTRRLLAARAFSRTAAYDAAVSTWLSAETGDDTPPRRAFAGHLIQHLRYGENPHQKAAFYADGSNRPGVATARQLQGKELSYNNINDTDAALELVADLDGERPGVAIIKHANPCGVATADTLAEAYSRAHDCDRTSAFGGIVALNRPLDAETARRITEIFTEVVIAPGADEGARAIFAGRTNLRLLITENLPDPKAPRLAWRQVAGGFLVQDEDIGQDAPEFRVVTERAPSAAELADLRFAWVIGKHVRSNAIVYVKDGATVGIGAGQMSRVDSTRIAARKAEDMKEALALPEVPTRGSVVASDAFFPFADGLITAAEAGATAIIQPGGSVRDEEVIAAANRHGLAMVFTGMRHFRH